MDGMSESTLIAAGAKLTVIDALKVAILDDVEVEVQDLVPFEMPAKNGD
jgi:hypothetical protein